MSTRIERGSMLWYEHRLMLRYERRSMLWLQSVIKYDWLIFWHHRRLTPRLCHRSTVLHLLDSFLSRDRLTTLQQNEHNVCYRILIDLKPVALES
ncbi:hypothetical protein DY000_02009605 [Brassica cretica]|uniref:Uncharacterized protein n=1 Tax=Brassica cretica TaxID=69181 RepID=A0ABQ7C3F1_BRACR|nr:hypothetical protein DY000_02009605 [Brassica cretica]